MGAKTESTKDKVVNFFRAQTKDSAPVPRLLSAIKEAKANIPTFDSFHASMRLDNDSLKALKNQAGDFAAIASSALSSVKTALSNLVNSSENSWKLKIKYKATIHSTQQVMLKLNYKKNLQLFELKIQKTQNSPAQFALHCFALRLRMTQTNFKPIV